MQFNLKLHYNQKVVSIVYDQSNFIRGRILLVFSELKRGQKVKGIDKNKTKQTLLEVNNNNLNMFIYD